MGDQIIKVRHSGPQPHNGVLQFGPHHARCALGRAGIKPDKKEGDGATPAGRYPLRRIWHRADRVTLPETAFETVSIRRKSGWCDASGHAAYNRPVNLPFTASHEKLWRRDGLYDVFFELGHNDAPPQKGRGSAVFLHLPQPAFRPTEGCVAVSPASMRFILVHARPGCLIDIG